MAAEVFSHLLLDRLEETAKPIIQAHIRVLTGYFLEQNGEISSTAVSRVLQEKIPFQRGFVLAGKQACTRMPLNGLSAADKDVIALCLSDMRRPSSPSESVIDDFFEKFYSMELFEKFGAATSYTIPTIEMAQALEDLNLPVFESCSGRGLVARALSRKVKHYIAAESFAFDFDDPGTQFFSERIQRDAREVFEECAQKYPRLAVLMCHPTIRSLGKDDDINFSVAQRMRQGDVLVVAGKHLRNRMDLATGTKRLWDTIDRHFKMISTQTLYEWTHGGSPSLLAFEKRSPPAMLPGRLAS